MTFTGKNCNDSNEVLRDLKPSLFDKEKILMRDRRRYVSLRDAIALVMVLPGKIATETRAKFAAIIEKYIELQHDAESGTTTVKLQSEPIDVRDSGFCAKRARREELELLKMEEEVYSMRASRQETCIRNMHSFMNLMTTIRPDWMESDVRFRLQTEDMIKNVLVQPGSSQILTNGDESIQSPSLSISQLAQELGCKPLTHAESIAAGRLAVKRYRAKYDSDPPKHRQWVDGAERSVNSYTEADRILLTSVLSDLGLVPDS